jgi:hypothetical protein
MQGGARVNQDLRSPEGAACPEAVALRRDLHYSAEPAGSWRCGIIRQFGVLVLHNQPMGKPVKGRSAVRFMYLTPSLPSEPSVSCSDS